MKRKTAFSPIATSNTRILILGSLPGQASLAAQRYYAHPMNRFWHLVGAVIGCKELPSMEYTDRLALLRKAGIGLWDTVASAHRSGSLDTAIRNAELAPLAEFIATLPDLRAVAFNGATAARIGRKQLAATPLTLIDLPSSSPAYAAMPLAEKRARWRVLKDFLA